MGAPTLPYKTRQQDGFTVIELGDQSLIDRDQLKRVSDDLDAFVERGNPPQLVISFVNIQYVSSSFIGKLMGLHKRVAKKGGKLTLSDVNPRIREIFTLTKLDSAIPIVAAVDHAARPKPWKLIAILAAAALVAAAAAIAFVKLMAS